MKSRAIRSSAIAVVLAAVTGTMSAAPADPLARHAWKHRVALLFGDGGTRQHEFLGALAARACSVRNRQLVIGRIAREGGALDDRTLTEREIVALTEGVGWSGGPLFVLIGKDGGEKMRRATPPTADELFAVIDGMTMRRLERPADEPCAEEDR